MLFGAFPHKIPFSGDFSMKRFIGYSSLALSGLLLVNNAAAQAAPWAVPYTSPTASGNCDSLPTALNSQFTIEPIVSRALFTDPQPARIVKMAFRLNPTTQKADIFIAEKGSSVATPTPARILYYDASATPSPTLKVIGTFTQAYLGFAESGVWGLAINPQTFEQDNFLYVIYSAGTASTPSATNGWRVSRFKLDATTRMMDMGSEKILLHIPAGTANRWHTGTSMRFDNFGNLYIGAADNEATSNGPANTADYRGGILRIKPDTTVARGYTIPAGNFGEYWASQFQAQGNTARANAYRDTSIVKAEIYVKGSRNPYVFGVDPNRLGWLAWAECGPDRTGPPSERAEEHNFTTKPAFSGWPYWVGNGVRQTGYAASYDEAGEPKSDTAWQRFNPVSMTTAVPVNNQPGVAGYDTLPPMHLPYTTQSSGCAMGGPIIRYDSRINNPDKMPPHLDNVIITSNQAGGADGAFYAIKINPDSAKTTGSAVRVFTMAKSSTGPSLRYAVEFMQGPDGVLYSVDWAEGCCGSRSLQTTEGIVKVRYTGTCKDSALSPVAIQVPRNLPQGRTAEWLRMGSTSFQVSVPGAHEAMILNIQGRVLHTFRGEGHKTYNLPALGAGTYVLRVKTTEGIVSRPLAAGL
jgi:hypothetical protein